MRRSPKRSTSRIDSMQSISSKPSISTYPSQLNRSSSNHIQTFSPVRHESPTKKAYSLGFSRSGSFSLHDPVASTQDSQTDETLFEEAFRSHLGALKRLLLQYEDSISEGNVTPNGSSNQFLHGRAQQLANEDIRRTVTKMSSLQSGTGSHSVAAFSYVGSKLLDDVERLVAKEDCFLELKSLRKELSEMSDKYQSLQSHMANQQVENDRRVAALEEENRELLERVTVTMRKNNVLMSELGARNSMDEAAHEKYVQLHLQSVNYHTRVNQLVGAAEGTIRARMGFVPRGVQERFSAIRDLPAPGNDIAYTKRTSKTKKKATKKNGDTTRAKNLQKGSAWTAEDPLDNTHLSLDDLAASDGPHCTSIMSSLQDTDPLSDDIRAPSFEYSSPISTRGTRLSDDEDVLSY
mmetsp:Transcript_3878/g.6062  ORF Transcript_3878/g.6062 Transcript_3878/m.6062 type:complete len:407 (+) Transcript_3878:29-1249(+)